MGQGGGPAVVVTGGTGFVGTPVVRELLLRGARVRALVRHREPGTAGRAGGVGQPPVEQPPVEQPPVEQLAGDLTRPSSLRGLCAGADVLVHLAARVSGEEPECRAVNEEGTRAVLAEARRAGVRRIVQVGTAAVYRDGVHRGAAEGELEEAPASAASRTRLAGERLVLAAGGTVLRPHLVYGTGDRWVIPSLVDLVRRLPHWVDGGRARMSLISVDSLAGAVADLALGTAGEGNRAGRVLHACHPRPVTARELVTAAVGALGLPPPDGEVDLAGAREKLGAHRDPRTGRLLSLLAVDHWYDGSRLWETTGASPGAGFAQTFPAYAAWYREALGQDRPTSDPDRTASDPGRTTGGPHLTAGDPHRTTDGPHRTASDPDRTASDPHRTTDGPHRTAGGPHRTAGGPRLTAG